MKPNELHISLDFWNTLVVGNPVYAEERTRIFEMYFNKDVQDVKQTYLLAKRTIDRLAREEKKSFKPSESVAMVCRLLTGKTVAVDADVIELLSHLRKAFRKHPPLWDNSLIDMLRQLQYRGVTLSILSNTNFIGGDIIREVVLNDEKWRAVNFEFALFSSETGFVKPDHRAFQTISHCVETEISKDRNIIHIGDDLICDLFGGNVYNIVSMLVSCPADTLRILKHVDSQLGEK